LYLKAKRNQIDEKYDIDLCWLKDSSFNPDIYCDDAIRSFYKDDCCVPTRLFHTSAGETSGVAVCKGLLFF